MITMQGPDGLASDDEESQGGSPDEDSQDQRRLSPKAATIPNNPQPGLLSRPSIPMQKRRRVTRACDECRRKKIKCDGKQPCTHCTAYSYECTYDQPSNRRRNPAPAYIEALESRLQKAEAILRTVLPGANLGDPKFDAHDIGQIIDSAREAKPNVQTPRREPRPNAVQDDDAQLQTMVEGTASLDLDDQGHWDYHGESSGFTFFRNLRGQFGDSFVPVPRIPSSQSHAVSHMMKSSKPVSSSPYDFHIPHPVDLPDRATAMHLCRNTLDVACALIRFVHKPNFYGKVNRIFDTDPDNYTNADTQFLPLLYVVLAEGCLYAQTEDTKLATVGYESAIEQGFQYFQTARSMLDITDCRDLTTLQAIVFMILFLQSTATLATCYSHIGIALRACCRLGLHRNIKNDFDPIEQEERKRIFWIVRKMDTYVGAFLGLPQMLSAEDVDQDLPLELEDEYVTAEGLLPMPPERFPLISASNAHTSLIAILRKVVKFIYPIKGFEGAQPREPYSVSHLRIRDIEQDLQKWMDELPMELRPSDDAPSELARAQQLLRLSYSHVQMRMYQPFLHYVSQEFEGKNVDKRSYACAAACVSVSRNIVHITAEMKRRGLLIGSYWFVMYTSYFAIVSLAFFVFENPRSPTGNDIMNEATEGRDMLASLSRRSFAADRCTQSLKVLFAKLQVNLKERGHPTQPTPTSRKRPDPGHDLAMQKDQQSVPNLARPAKHVSPCSPIRASRFANAEMEASSGQPRSVPNSSRLSPPFHDRSHFQSERWSSGPTSAAADSELTGQTPPFAEGDSVSQQIPLAQQLVGDLPDLRNLMYPSANPFAYGNQPLSILEDFRMIAPELQTPFTGPTCAFGTPGSDVGASDMPFDGFSNTTLGIPPQQGPYDQERHDPISAPRRNQPHFQMDPGNLNVDEGFWQQLGKERTGLTPGINLDELFGSDGGWNPAYMDQGLGSTQR